MKPFCQQGCPWRTGERPTDFPGDYRSARTLSEEDYGWFLELTGDSSRDLRRQVLHIRRYTTADLRGAYFIRPVPCRRHPVVEGDGIPSDDPSGCPPGSGGHGLADGGMAAAAPVQISADSRWASVPDVLVRLLHLSAFPSGNAAVSGRNPGPSGG